MLADEFYLQEDYISKLILEMKANHKSNEYKPLLSILLATFLLYVFLYHCHLKLKAIQPLIAPFSFTVFVIARAIINKMALPM